MKGQDSMTSTSLVTPCFGKKFVTDIADQERRERNPDNKKDQLKTTLHNTRTFYYLYTCKTVVLIIIYSSIELTLVFDRTDYRFRSKRPSIETTFDRTDLLPSRRSVEENNIQWSKLCVQWSVERLQDTGKFPASKLNRSVDRTLWNGWVLLPVLWLKITVMCSILRKAGRRMKPCDCMHASWSFAFALKVNFLNFQAFE